MTNLCGSLSVYNALSQVTPSFTYCNVTGGLLVIVLGWTLSCSGMLVLSK